MQLAYDLWLLFSRSNFQGRAASLLPSPYAVMCPCGSSFLPPLIHHPRIRSSYIHKESGERELWAGWHWSGTPGILAEYVENDTWAGRLFVKAHWSSSPASLSSLSHCPQHQDRFTVLFLHLWPLSCLPCSGKCQEHHFCWTTADALTEWMKRTRLS